VKDTIIKASCKRQLVSYNPKCTLQGLNISEKNGAHESVGENVLASTKSKSINVDQKILCIIGII
jgi:hypothetical protein